MNLGAAVEAVVGSYPGLGGSSINRSSWVVFSDDGKVHKSHLHHVCHSAMYSDPIGCDQCVTNFKTHKDKLDLSWFDFMKNVLYAKFKDHIHLGTTESGDNYLHLTGLDKLPANVCYNICITSRFILEFRDNIKIWKKLCDQGIPPLIAFMCCGSDAGADIDAEVDGIFDNAGNTNHWPIDNCTDPFRVMNGKFNLLSVPFKEYPRSVMPCNAMWGNELGGLRPLEGSTIREFSDKLIKENQHDENVLQSS